jgi:choloylglycine hydrolase
VVVAAVLLAAVAPAGTLLACSRVLWNDGGRGVIVGRNMDWFAPLPVDFYVLPRGIRRDGMTGKDALTWTARYGSLVVATRGGCPDGINERGLAGHMLWLAAADYGAEVPGTPSLGIGLWLQYYLDNFASVRELVAFTREHPFQVVPGRFDGLETTVHLALEDPTGDSAVIEYQDGRARIYHGREYTVMTNDPPYDQQLRRLKDYEGFGGDRPLPGTNQAADRFVRAAYFLKRLPEPHSEREAIAEILGVMRNVGQPFSLSDARAPGSGSPHDSATRWRTVIDLTRGIYFFESTTSPNIIWVRLDGLKFAEGEPIRKLDLAGSPDRVGDCSGDFAPATPFEVLRPERP